MRILARLLLFLVGAVMAGGLGGGSLGGSTGYQTNPTVSSLTLTGNLNLGTGTAIQRNSVQVSSFAVSGALSGSYTNVVDTVCVTGSTVTVTLQTGGPGIVEVSFNGSVTNPTINGLTALGVLVDGGQTAGETNSALLVAAKSFAAVADAVPASFNVILTGLSAAQHNFCLAILTGANQTSTVESTNSVAKFSVHML